MFDDKFKKRFWPKVDNTSKEDCWNWTANKSNGGYGLIKYKNSTISAHRVSYILLKGKIPDGLVLDHLCRNRSCVNPDHLEIVTQRENILRGNGSPAKNAKKEFCIRGHSFKERGHLDKHGRRICLECKRIRASQDRKDGKAKRYPYDPEKRKIAYERSKIISSHKPRS